MISARSPIAPSASRLTRRRCWAWNGKTKASHSSAPGTAAAASSTSAVWAVPTHSGFSHSTALPARSARIAHSACSELGRATYTASTSGDSTSAA